MIQTVLETGLFPAIHAPSVFGGKIMHKRSEVRSSVVSYPAPIFRTRRIGWIRDQVE